MKSLIFINLFETDYVYKHMCNCCFVIKNMNLLLV